MLNVAMVGLGRWGQRLVDAVSTPGSAKLRFTHAVTRTPDKVRAYCSARGLSLTDDLARVLADPDVDAVALATPHSQHADQVAAAAKAGKHVFVEKPFTLDAASARAAARACRDAGVVLAPGHNRRFLPALAEMKRIVAAGGLGDILHLEGNFSGNAGLGYQSGVRRVEYPQVDIERAELEAFADAVAGAASYPVPVEDAIHGIAVMEAAIRSAASGGERVAVENFTV